MAAMVLNNLKKLMDESATNFAETLRYLGKTPLSGKMWMIPRFVWLACSFGRVMRLEKTLMTLR